MNGPPYIKTARIEEREKIYYKEGFFGGVTWLHCVKGGIIPFKYSQLSVREFILNIKAFRGSYLL